MLPLATGVLLVALVAVSLLSWSWSPLGRHALADGTTWTPVSGLPANTALAGVACPNGGGLLCAAVGDPFSSGQAPILTTTNGTTWTPVSGLPATVLNGIACPNGGGLLCMAVGYTSSGPALAAILTTTNGTTWTPVSGLPGYTVLHGIACPNVGGLLCAAVGSTSNPSPAVILTTTNGTTWTPVSGLPIHTVLLGIACPNVGGLLCAAVGANNVGQAVIFTTTNGTTWTPVSGLSASVNFSGIACPNVGSLLCVAVGSASGQTAIFTTTNGTTWTPVSSLPANTYLGGVACPNGGGLLCAAVGPVSLGGQAVILTTTNGTIWTSVSGLPANTYLGGVACPNGGGLLCAAVGSTSSNQAVILISTVSSGTPNCATGWSCADIGSPGLSGSQTVSSSGIWTVQGGGSDIWTTADQFHFISQPLPADGSVSARVVTQSNSDPWGKAGVMLRQTSDPGSAYYAAYVTPGNGIAVQYRTAQGASAQWLVGWVAGTVPIYLAVTRTGSTYSAYTSSDGVTWTFLAGSSVTMTMSGSVLAGLAVTAHTTSSLMSVTFDTVSVSPNVPGSSGCSSGWSCGDIGGPALVGSQALSGSTWTVQGGGSDIWTTADQFHFVSQPLPADGSVSARVVTQSNSDPWGKAGVMLRQTSDPGSAYYAAYVTPGNGIAVQYRTAQGASAQWLMDLAGTAPIYLAVARTGSTYSAYTSSNGITWTLVADSSVTMTMSGSVLAGLAVTAHTTSSLMSVTFDTVYVGPTIP
jgi:hypothetical protein